MNRTLLIVMMGMMLLMAPYVASQPLEFNEGLTLTLEEFNAHGRSSNDERPHVKGENLTLHSGVYDAKTGVKLEDANCSLQIVRYEPLETVYEKTDFAYVNDTTEIDGDVLNTTGEHKAEFWCHNDDSTKGGFVATHFDVVEETAFGFWSEPDDWTFPIVYLLLTVLLIGFAFANESSLLGVLGGLMLIFSYFLIGATSPILFTPLLIVGIILTFKFASL